MSSCIEIDDMFRLFRFIVATYHIKVEISLDLRNKRASLYKIFRAYAKYFIGNSYLKPLTDPKKTVFIANVTFEPGCRNNWHIHHAKSGGGQLLVCVDGEGWYQEEGKPAQSLKPGDVVTIPAGVKHWHGAKAGSWFSHLAVECPGEETSNEWLEPVTDEVYAKLGE